MADDNGFKELRGHDFRIYDRAAQWCFNIWNGRLYLQISERQGERNNDGPPKYDQVARVLLSQETVAWLTHTLRSLAKGERDIIMCITSTWDPTTKTLVPSMRLIIKRGENGVAVMEITADGKSYSVPLMANNRFSTGSEPMDERTRSSFSLMMLADYFERYVPAACIATNYKRDFRGGGSGGSRRPATNMGGGGARASYDDSDAMDDLA